MAGGCKAHSYHCAIFQTPFPFYAQPFHFLPTFFYNSGMAVPTKEEVRSLLYARLTSLLQSTDEEVSLKAAKELGTIAGIYAEVSPKQLTAQQTNQFYLAPDTMAKVVESLRKVAGGPTAIEEGTGVVPAHR